jgi:excisionase family DNA binding protein
MSPHYSPSDLTALHISLGAAARKTGLHKTTLSRAISTGRLPAVRSNGPRGGWLIDPAELERLWPSNRPPTVSATVSATVAAPDAIALRDARIAEQAETILDLRKRLDTADARLAELMSRRWWKPWR